MKRSLTKVVIQDGKIRYRLTIEGETCLRGTQEARYEQFNLLKSIAEDPTFTACGLNDFQKLTMMHVGDRWIVECEAIEEKK